jgi:hypothetical protein
VPAFFEESEELEEEGEGVDAPLAEVSPDVLSDFAPSDERA